MEAHINTSVGTWHIKGDFTAIIGVRRNGIGNVTQGIPAMEIVTHRHKVAGLRLSRQGYPFPTLHLIYAGETLGICGCRLQCPRSCGQNSCTPCRPADMEIQVVCLCLLPGEDNRNHHILLRHGDGVVHRRIGAAADIANAAAANDGADPAVAGRSGGKG